MTDRFISSVHIQKLGHKLQEIRERALVNIISKLDNGFVYDSDLARSRELLLKLFEWFEFEPCLYQDKVLNLIRQILTSKSGITLTNHYGSKTICSELRQMRSYIDQRLYTDVDDLLNVVQSYKREEVNIPPLFSDLPLSYRTEDECLPFGQLQSVESTATPIEGIVRHSSSLAPQTGISKGSSGNTCSAHLSIQTPVDSLHISYTLRWQPLIASDRHVLESVEQSLKNPTEPSSLLHSCEFFMDVLLQDFPAEVFLQRPAIVLLFVDYMKASVSSRLTNAILNCFLKLTKCIKTRIYYYSDPCTFNSKVNISTEEYGVSSPFISNGTYMPNINLHRSTTHLEDVEFLKTKQLLLPQYCFTTMLSIFEFLYVKPESLRRERTKTNLIGINLALILLDELICLLNLCLKSNAWDKKSIPGVIEVLHTFEKVLEKFSDAVDHFRLDVASDECNTTSRSTHLRLLCSCTNLLVRLIPLNVADFILPRTMKNALSNCLLDSSLARLYPTVHETIFLFVKEFGGRFETDSVTKYKEVNEVCTSITSYIKFVRNSNSLPVVTAIELANDAVASLAFHGNLSFIGLVINLFANKLPMRENEDCLRIAENVILELFAHTNIEIRKETYKQCDKRVIATIGPKYNSSGTGAPGSQILFLLRAPILLEITLYGLNNEDKEVQKHADNILVHVLKCKILVTEDIWNKVVEAILPILPIMTCHATKKTTLGRTIIGILDPDTAKSLLIPPLEVLKNNLCLLFANDSLTREEAISRLCWLLTSQNNSRSLLPRLNSLQDKALSKACQVQRVADINKERPSHHFYQSTALHQVLELLNTDNVEPMIRRSALTQLSVMLEDSHLHYAFIDCNGIQIILTAMGNALMEDDYKDYVDCVIPAISILKYICLHNATGRQELCQNFDLYCNILRGLFIFCSEERMRQDCSILFSLLLFNGFLLGSPANMDLSLPYLVLEQLSMPFTCNMHWRTSKHSLPDLPTTLLSDKWCKNSIQIHWNSEWFGGFAEILKWKEVQYSEVKDEFGDCLRLTNNSLLTLKSSSVDYCISKCLIDVQNGTYHSDIIDSISKLDSYLQLFVLAKNCDELEKGNLLKFPWELSFHRFLHAPPATEEDMLLLIAILRFLATLIPVYSLLDETCWIFLILKSPSHILPNLLQMESNPDFEIKTLHQELLSLITICIWHEQHYMDLHSSKANEQQTATWLHVVKIIAQNLKFNESQHFYNLSYLDCMLSCLVHLTTALGWSHSKKGVLPKEPIPNLITGLCELISAFHCGKGSSAADSLMGLSITRHITLILNNLLMEMQYADAKGWEMCFIAENEVEESILCSVCALWLSRDIVLRAAVLQLLAGLATSPRAAIELVHKMKDCKTGYGVWETMLTILLDNKEASIVRENAANLLFNLTSHTETSSNDLLIITNLVPLKYKKEGNAISAILDILDEFKFFMELTKILENLYSKSHFNFGYLDEKLPTEVLSPKYLLSKGEMTFAYTKNLIYNDLLATSAKNGNLTVLVTPALVKNIALFVDNLLLLAGGKVTNSLQEYGLIKMFFRCLSKPYTDIKITKDLAVYCDILEMNAAICTVLTKAVSNSLPCLNIVLHTRDCLNVLLSLLNPSLYYTGLAQLVYLRNKLWTEIFTLIGCLLDVAEEKGDFNVPAAEVLTVVTNTLNECGHQAFLQTLCESISSNSSCDLQHSALMSLTSLLRVEADSKTCLDLVEDEELSSSPSVKMILDCVKTPRTPSERLETEHIKNKKSENKKIEILWERKPHKGITEKQNGNVFENAYFSRVSNKLTELNKRHIQPENESQFNKQSTENESPMAGATICKILLHLYDASNIKNKDKKTNIILNTLTSILCVSSEAKKLGLQNGLMEMIVQQLKEVHAKLSLESVSCLRRISDKKRVCPILKQLGSVIGLTTNFMLGDESVKGTASVLGFADVIHKLWIWFCVDRSLLSDALKMLCTYTTNCYLACQSLPLTSAVAGSGPRKVPSNISVLHELVSLVYREMDLASRTHDLSILELVFHVLHNCCSVLECRNILMKTTLLQCLSRLHPAITKKQKTWENIEFIWLEFLLTLTGYCEGQLCVAKATDSLEIIMMLTSSTKASNRKAAILVLRNIAFHQLNRPRLINSADFIKILQTKLTNGSIEEKIVIVTIIWALIAKNQRAKLILKCAGLDVKLQDVIKQLSVCADEVISPENFHRMQCVLGILKEGEKVK